jgi:hypothetical protein
MRFSLRRVTAAGCPHRKRDVTDPDHHTDREAFADTSYPNSFLE